ncbi:MFS transporter [Acinetobacter sp. ANC 3813]|uniref:MFS transporter n=1 Tax=Acinetobacter sp. ANC 3813 TaxID=1977873 RepID=UPI000A33DB63|nr:MFS transporter [Acinetobacter sp. ANC 3813]OTG90867.1 MFS transporter [Acinetobacter sp. ANC 3813]
MDVNENSVIAKAMDRKVTLRLMPLLLVCYVFANLDRINIGFAKMQMSMDLGFSDTMYGLGAGLFFIAYALFGLPSNMALDKFGAKRWICTIMVIWGILSAGMCFVKTAEQFYTLRFLLGAAEAGFFPGIILYITRWFPRRRRATMSAWFALAVPIAGILGGPISGLIIDGMNHVSGLSGWQWMFILEGIPVLFLGYLVYKILPDTINEATFLTAQEKAQLVGELNAEETKKTEAATSFAGIFFNKYVWILVIMYFAVRLSVNTLSYWMPTFIHGTGVSSNTTVGFLTAIPYIAGVIFMLYIGRSSDRTGERRWHLFTCMVMSAIGLAIAGVMSSSVVAVMIGLSIACMGGNAALPLYWQFPPAFLTTAMLSAGLAIISSFGSIASFAAPYMIGWMRDNIADPGMALYIISFMIFLGALVVLTIPAKQVNRTSSNENTKSGVKNEAVTS